MFKAAELLQEQPLCDRCLGRMFARLGLGLSNKERGRAFKILIMMSLHRRIKSGDKEAEEGFKRLAPRLGGVASKLYEELFQEELKVEECSICGDKLEPLIGEASVKASELVARYGARSFLVGCRVPRRIVEAEEALKLRHGLIYAESIGNEVKREVGKRVKEMAGVEPEFMEPDMVVLIDFETGAVEPHPLPIMFRGRYWKLGRRISQSRWVLSGDRRKYPFSVEEALEPAARLAGASRAILHAAGREDVDARMLGTGRPMIVELKMPARLDVDPKEAEDAVNGSQGLVKVALEERASRRDVRFYKSERARTRKIYRALFIVEEDVGEDRVAELERIFINLRVRQQTPLRVLHRRADVVRYRKVFSVRLRRLAPRIFEALIDSEGGLYIKELISGDGGRTEPSFSSILGTQATCLELDVIYVEL